MAPVPWFFPDVCALMLWLTEEIPFGGLSSFVLDDVGFFSCMNEDLSEHGALKLPLRLCLGLLPQLCLSTNIQKVNAYHVIYTCLGSFSTETKLDVAASRPSRNLFYNYCPISY